MNVDTFHHASRESQPSQHEAGSEHVTSIDEPMRALAFRTLMLIVAIEPLIIFGVLIAIGLPWALIAIVFAGSLLLGTAIFWIIVQAFWKPWQRRYPAQPVLAGAVSKSWQSFGFGAMTRLNNCLTIVADERHLHLRAFAPMRMLGAGTISLPLDRIQNVRPSPLTMRMLMTADLDGRRISGPAWCLSLAAQNDAPEEE